MTNRLDAELPFVVHQVSGDIDAFMVALFQDGILRFVALFAVLLAVLRHMLQQESRAVTAWLAASVGLAAGLRWWLARDVPLEGWFYFRVVPLADSVFRGPVLQLLSGLAGLRIYQTDVNAWTNFVLSSLSPLVFFAHARYALKDVRAGLAAAFLIAVLPIHIRFALSDVYNVQVAVLSSFTFVMLYRALHETDPRWVKVSFVVLPILCTGTYFSRPEAIIYWPLDVAAALVASYGLENKSRRNWIIFILSATGLLTIVLDPFHRYGDTGQVASLQTFRNAIDSFFSWRNTLRDLSITPLPLVPLAIHGCVVLWRGSERLRLLLLVGWLLGFYTITSYVLHSNLAMGARYQLAFATPFVLLMAASFIDLARRPAWVWGTAVAWTALAPLSARAFIRDVDYEEQIEWTFIRSMRDTLPEGCSVLEPRETMVFSDPPQLYHSRFDRLGRRLEKGLYTLPWTSVPLAEDRKNPDGTITPALTAEARAVLAHPPACLAYYEGLACLRGREGPGAPSTFCRQMHERFSLTPIASQPVVSHEYARGCSGALLLPQQGEEEFFDNPIEGQRVDMTVYRVGAPVATPEAPASATGP